MSGYLVIFGAAVKADGSPSGTLSRRVQSALDAWRSTAGVKFMPTGGLTGTGYVEAEVVRGLLLQAGVADGDIIVEPTARDTLESVRRCSALLRAAGDVSWVAPCTSRYHVLRCAALLRASGWSVRLFPLPRDLGLLPMAKLIWYYCKEVIALPYDLALILLQRRES